VARVYQTPESFVFAAERVVDVLVGADPFLRGAEDLFGLAGSDHRHLLSVPEF